MANSIIGFHLGPGGKKDGLGAWVQNANQRGIPVGLKASDEYGPLFQAVNIGRQFNVANWLGFRFTQASGRVSREVPSYLIDPAFDAPILAQEVIDNLPPEFDKSVFIELINEPRGKTNPGDVFYNNMAACDYLGEWCYAAAVYLNSKGYKFIGPSFNSGEPGEPGQPLSDAVKQYSQPGMLKYLRYCADNPDKAALSVHDYVWNNPPPQYPQLWGRWEAAIAAADNAGIARTFPIFVTEFGYSLNNAPEYPAVEMWLDWYNRQAARFPQIKAVAAWTLQGDYEPVDSQVNTWMLYPTYKEFEAGPQPTRTHEIFGATLPGGNTTPMTWQQKVWQQSQLYPYAVLAFAPNAGLQMEASKDGYQVTTNEWDEPAGDGTVIRWRGAVHPLTGEKRVYWCVIPQWDKVFWYSDPGTEPPPTPLGYDSPVGTAAERATTKIWPGSWFSANPYGNRYQFPDGSWHIHTGDDLNLNVPVWNSDANKPVYAVADGVVTHAQLVIKSNGQPSTWGKLAVIKHPDGMFSRYGHLRQLLVKVGDIVKRGQQIGTVGGTEYGLPDHKHIDLSPSGILETNPTYWPGDNLAAVQQHFVDPKKWIEAHRGEVVEPPTPPAGIEMAPYFFPAAGDFGDILILKNSWGTGDERQQLQRDGSLSYVVKNSQWERRRIAADGIRLEMDTSPGNGEYYTITGSPWLPLSWNVGDEYMRTETVKYFKKAGCQLVRQGNSTNKIRFEAHYPAWTSSANITINDVIELAWIIGGQVEERYWFGRNLGLVAWQNKAGLKSWVSERIPVGQQGNNVRESGCFG